MTEPLEPTPAEENETDSPLSLPEPVRARVMALAADGLGRLAPEHLPAPLKRVAAFAPARRARLAGTQIASVLESDETFRERLGVQVRAMVGELAQALAEGRVPAAADPVEAAATAYLIRSPRWPEVVRAADDAVRADRRAAGARQTEEQVSRLRRRVAQLQDEAQTQRARSKDQVDRLKAENQELRHKLGEARARLREARGGDEDAAEEPASETAAAREALAAAEAESRRLRARVGELEEELAGVRRSERSARVGESVRAKLLVDTLVTAAQGLQRELGLPPVDRMPADTVTADIGGGGPRTSSGRGSLPVDDPALLEELLRLPRTHLVVDGYNVTKTTWPDLPLDRQRERLLSGMAALMSRTAAEITVVFDAAETRHRPPVVPPRGVRVLFSPFGVIADDVIRDLVAAEPSGRNVVVASSDRAVADDVRSAGFWVVSAAVLAALVARGRP